MFKRHQISIQSKVQKCLKQSIRTYDKYSGKEIRKKGHNDRNTAKQKKKPYFYFRHLKNNNQEEKTFN